MSQGFSTTNPNGIVPRTIDSAKRTRFLLWSSFLLSCVAIALPIVLLIQIAGLHQQLQVLPVTWQKRASELQNKTTQQQQSIDALDKKIAQLETGLQSLNSLASKVSVKANPGEVQALKEEVAHLRKQLDEKQTIQSLVKLGGTRPQDIGNGFLATLDVEKASPILGLRATIYNGTTFNYKSLVLNLVAGGSSEVCTIEFIPAGRVGNCYVELPKANSENIRSQGRIEIRKSEIAMD